MLYLSRHIGPFEFGVVDSDDDVETKVSMVQLKNIACEKGLKIAGVHVAPTGLSCSRSITKVIPYKYPAYQTVDCVKAYAVLGVGVTLWRDHIVSIERFDGYSDIVLRLSDYGSILADKFLSRSTMFRDERKMTLVFDDSLTLLPYALINLVHGYSFYNVFLDIRAVRNVNLVRCIYETVGDKSADAIIDAEDRKRKMLY